MPVSTDISPRASERSLHESWPNVVEATYALGTKIVEHVYRIEEHALETEEHEQETDKGYHKIAYVPPGGMMAALVLGGHLGFPPDKYLQVGVTKKYYLPEDAEQEYDVSVLPSRKDVEGLNILLFDDFWRSGGLLKFARGLLVERGANRVDWGAIYAIPPATIPPKNEGDVQPKNEGKEQPILFYGVAADESGVSSPWDRLPYRVDGLRSIRIPTVTEVIAVQASTGLVHPG